MGRICQECALLVVSFFQPIEREIERSTTGRNSIGRLRVDSRFDMLCASIPAAAAEVARNGFRTLRNVK